MKVLFFGDIIGRIGRQAIQKIVAEIKTEFEPDLVIANAENIAHGIGATKKTLQEISNVGIDFFTSGNHILKKPEAAELLDNLNSNLIRPANFPANSAGKGYRILSVGSRQVLVINLVGQVFMKDEYTNPFKQLDQILEEVDPSVLAGIIVDFHAEATSEKAAFGWYADGKVSAVLGTHTHVPTADTKILPGGTAFVSDVGMVGASDSVIGDSKEPIIESFLLGENPKIEIPESGSVDVGAVLVEINPTTRQATSIIRVDKKIQV